MGAAVPVRRAKIRALLGYLAVNTNHAVGIDRLVSVLWDNAPPSARANLRNYLTELRRLLTGGMEPVSRLVVAAGGIQLRCVAAELDLSRYQQQLHSGRECVARNAMAAAATHYRLALEQWRGPILEGTPRTAALDGEFARIEQSRLDATEEAAELHLQLGKYFPELVDQLREVLSQHPYRERACACLMTALYRAGNPAAALDAYRALQHRLGSELGIAPTPRLKALQVAILNHDHDVLLALGRHRATHE